MDTQQVQLTGTELMAQIQHEISTDPYYAQNFSNDGQRFVGWYLRRVLLRDPVAAKDDLTDGKDDKWIDAVIVDDDDQRVLVIQGKFIKDSKVDSGPLEECLSAWLRLQDLPALQKDCNEQLKRKLEAVRKALEDEYRIDFELLTTGELTEAAKSDLKVFAEKLGESDDFTATLTLVDTDLLETRLAEADAHELPSLRHTIKYDPSRTLVTHVANARTVVTLLPLKDCLTFPGITDGRLFRKNVRQSLGTNNKVNRELRKTLHSDRIKDFFFYHNGITALCDQLEVDEKNNQIIIKGLSVVNGCQSLSTIYTASEQVRSEQASGTCVLFRLYEIPERALADRISVNTNSQTAVKPRDLRSNDRVMVGLKRAYEARFPDGLFITKRGELRPADKDENKTIDAAIMAKMVMAWHCQRPNIAHNEKKLFDEYYKTIFRTGYNPASMLALQIWLNAIDNAWPNLGLDDLLKAGRSHVKYHLLFSVSALFANVNKQPQMVLPPSFTMKTAESPAEILPLAANCLQNAFQNAFNESQLSGRVFSPQNWLKSNSSVQGQQLVAGTIAGMLPSLPNGSSLIQSLSAPADGFVARWSAD
jgi:AIPR protein